MNANYAMHTVHVVGNTVGSRLIIKCCKSMGEGNYTPLTKLTPLNR